LRAKRDEGLRDEGLRERGQEGKEGKEGKEDKREKHSFFVRLFYTIYLISIIN
tara:strand:+ start:1681 stop:1839 length:159 start_codon:yes stop_codon:yes gene_type:complete